MAQQVQDLIDKIKIEGIQLAEEKAKEIELKAQEKASQILAQAEKDIEAKKKKAAEEIKRSEGSAQKALEQASRDMILSLHQELQATLDKLVLHEVQKALTTDHLQEILEHIIKDTLAGKTDSSTEIILNSKDLKALKGGFISKLQKEVKKGVQFQATDDMREGLRISFDEGKSSFDFSDVSLAEYLSRFLNEQIAAILKDSVSDDG